MIKPSHGLAKGLFLGKLDFLDRMITTGRKSVFHAAKKVDLVRDLDFGEDLFSLAAKIGREQIINFFLYC